jgi:hypothetical protein
MTKYTHESIDSGMAKIFKLKAMFEKQKENVGKLERSLLRRKYAMYTPQELKKVLQSELDEAKQKTKFGKNQQKLKLSYIYGINGDYGDYDHLLDFVESIHKKDRLHFIKTGEIDP